VDRLLPDPSAAPVAVSAAKVLSPYPNRASVTLASARSMAHAVEQPIRR
jgi:hypothetical protein